MSPNRVLRTFFLLGLVHGGCGGSETTTPTIVPRQSAEEAILQVAKTYTVTSELSRLLDPPSALAIHRRRIETRLELAPERAVRQRTHDRLEYRDGRVVECSTESTRGIVVRYLFTNGQPTAQVRAPEAPLTTDCRGPVPAELPATLPMLEITLALRDEMLVVVAPSTDRRQFLPAD